MMMMKKTEIANKIKIANKINFEQGNMAIASLQNSPLFGQDLYVDMSSVI